MHLCMHVITFGCNAMWLLATQWQANGVLALHFTFTANPLQTILRAPAIQHLLHHPQWNDYGPFTKLATS